MKLQLTPQALAKCLSPLDGATDIAWRITGKRANGEVLVLSTTVGRDNASVPASRTNQIAGLLEAERYRVNIEDISSKGTATRGPSKAFLVNVSLPLAAGGPKLKLDAKALGRIVVGDRRDEYHGKLGWRMTHLDPWEPTDGSTMGIRGHIDGGEASFLGEGAKPRATAAAEKLREAGYEAGIAASRLGFHVYVWLPIGAELNPGGCTRFACEKRFKGELPDGWVKLDHLKPIAYFCPKDAAAGLAELGKMAPAAARQAQLKPASSSPVIDAILHKPMKIGRYETHPAADAFELMNAVDLDALSIDIKANGLEHPVILIKDRETGRERERILDGRNRMKACAMVKVEPTFKYYKGSDPYAFVRSLNIERRHLSEGQRAFAAAELERLGHGGDRWSETPSRADNARRLNAGYRSVTRAKYVLEHGTPELIKAGRAGVISVSGADAVAQLPEAKQRELVARFVDKDKGKGKEVKLGHVLSLARQEHKRDVVRKINTRPMPMPNGPFGQIFIDPSWPFENSDNHAGARGHTDYPPMSMERIHRLGEKIRAVADVNCVLWLAVVNAFVHEVGGILNQWRFDAQSMVTWIKTTAGGGDFVGLAPTNPRGATEHFILATRGKPIHTLNDTKTWFRAPVREHSRKPDEFFAEYTTKVAGPNLEMFAREERAGWKRWGAETELFAKKGAA